MIRSGILAVLVAFGAIGGPVAAQTAGSWTVAGDVVGLAAADGSSSITFQCDVAAGAMLVTINRDTGAVQPGRVTVRADNGTAYSVAMRQDAAGGLSGTVAMTLINQGAFAPATTLIITMPPSARPALIVDVVPEFSAVMGNCPRL